VTGLAPPVAEVRPLRAALADADGQGVDARAASCWTCAPAGCVLPASLTAPSLAREFLRRWACPDHLTDSDDALLLVSELVTNALIHGAPPIRLTMRCVDSRTVVRVSDSGHEPVLLQHPVAADALSGRGLRLLEVIATDWGVDTNARGHSVWFAL
jgi:anti-sigma regulatory factor (Ser/Thr protein kinase)